MSYSNQANQPLMKNGSNSTLDKLTKKDKIWIIVGIFFLIGSFDGGGPPILSLIIFAGVYIAVNNREQAKQRIFTILQLEPDNTVQSLANQLDKSNNYIAEVLKIMILDEGAQIRFDMNRGTVQYVPILRKQREEQARRVQTARAAQTAETVAAEVVPEAPVVAVQQETVVEEAFQAAAPPQLDKVPCVHCGIGLPSKARYCHNCGVKQF